MTRRLGWTLCLFCICAASACAQDMFSPAVSLPAAPSALTDEERMVVRVDVVEVYFNVRAGTHLVQGLTKDDFEIRENGRRESIRYFSPMANQPLRIGLMIDSSGSQNRVLQSEKEVAGKFLDQVLNEGDQAMVISFDSGVALREDFTASRDKLHQALSRVERVNSLPSAELGDTVKRGRSTALYDSIQLASDNRMNSVTGRKVFIILTDGEDNGSRAKPDEAITAALRSDAICYVLLIADSNVRSRANYQGEIKMKRLAESTGGRLIRVGKKLTDLPKHFDAISEELRNHYSLGYTPADRRSSGEYRSLKVLSKRGFHVQARQGYYAKFGQ